MDIFVFAAIAAGILLLAVIMERIVPVRRQVSIARRISIIGVCSALASVVMLFEIPRSFVAPGF